MKLLNLIALLIFIHSVAFTQKWHIEIGMNPLAPFEFADRYDNPNGTLSIYKETRITHFLNDNWGIAVFAGHQLRITSEYLIINNPSIPDYREIPYYIHRHLVPVGALAQYRNNKVISKLLGSNKQKWQLRLQAGLYTITGKDVYAKNKPEGEYVLRYEFPDYYGNLHFTATAGIGYKISNKWQLNLEGGFGALSYSMLYVGYTW